MARMVRKTLVYSRSKSSGNCVAGSRSREPFWSSGGPIPAKCAPRRAATSAGHRTVHDGRAPPMDLNRFPPDRLRGFAAAALVARDVPETDAALVAESLVEAELQGQPAHGLLRLPFLLDRLRAGLINPRPTLRLESERPAAVLLDADNALGPVAGVRAVDLAAERARRSGVGLVAVRRSNHLGSLGFYLRRCTAGGLVGLAFTNTPPAISPPGARTPYLGTNPIAAGFPPPGEPVIIDLATSPAARGH